MFFDAANNLTKYEKVTTPFEYYGMTYALGASSCIIFNFFHVSEMHLIIAESYARKGDTAEAKKWLEDFQRNRIRDYAGYTGNDLIQEIMNERRREFCFEYDMGWCDRIREQKGWSRNSYQDPENPVYTIDDNDYRFCLPIPLSEELQYNNIEQNPGWGMQ
jgi:hypothetical protein